MLLRSRTLILLSFAILAIAQINASADWGTTGTYLGGYPPYNTGGASNAYLVGSYNPTGFYNPYSTMGSPYGSPYGTQSYGNYGSYAGCTAQTGFNPNLYANGGMTNSMLTTGIGSSYSSSYGPPYMGNSNCGYGTGQSMYVPISAASNIYNKPATFGSYGSPYAPSNAVKAY
jgi:hypothetical protein